MQEWLQVLKATSEGELDIVFASLVRLGVGALLVAQEPAYNRWLRQIIALASDRAIPTRCTQPATLSWPAAWRAMTQAASTRSVKSAFMSAGFSKARSLLICR